LVVQRTRLVIITARGRSTSPVVVVVVLHLLRNILAHMQKFTVLCKAAPIDNVQAAQVYVRIGSQVDEVTHWGGGSSRGAAGQRRVVALQDLHEPLGEAKVADWNESVVPRELWHPHAHAVGVGNQAASVVVVGGKIIIAMLDAAQRESVHLQAELVDCVRVSVHLVAKLALAASALQKQLTETRNRMAHLG
jgi:hypothetical protein